MEKNKAASALARLNKSPRPFARDPELARRAGKLSWEKRRKKQHDTGKETQGADAAAETQGQE